MQNTHSNSYFSSVLFLVIDMKIVKTTTSILFFWPLVDIVAFLLVSIALTMAQVFGFILSHFSGINPSD